MFLTFYCLLRLRSTNRRCVKSAIIPYAPYKIQNETCCDVELSLVSILKSQNVVAVTRILNKEYENAFTAHEKENQKQNRRLRLKRKRFQRTFFFVSNFSSLSHTCVALSIVHHYKNISFCVNPFAQHISIHSFI